jgi:oxygen-independent coproporphyrinogen III oxidase
LRMSVYVHFPFCRSKCVYCDFCSFAADETAVERYCESMMQEMELAAAEFPYAEIATVYFGGGTPSVVPAPLMREVTQKLRDCFFIPPDAEFTSEANPGTVTDAWLETMAEAGMNRLSVGIQAKQERLLRLLGRIHTFPQAAEALNMARRHGIQNLSADLMYGLPTQTLHETLDSIRAAAGLGVRHISAYALKVEENTKLASMIGRGELAPPDDDLAADMMEAGIELLESLGYRRYEISNFANPGFESRHNLVYWKQEYYLGLGLNAASMLPAADAAYIRRSNTASLSEYESRIALGKLPAAETIPIGRSEAMFETVMLGLRTVDGVGYREFETMHGVTLPAAYAGAIRELEAKGWLMPVDPANPRLALNGPGLAMQNSALMPFMEANAEQPGKKVYKNNRKN